MSLRKKLRGTGVAIVTPFSNGEVDYEALGRLIEFTLDRGATYIVSLGTTGEVPVLSEKEKEEITNFTVKKIGGRAPCVIGIGGYNTGDILNTFEHRDLSAFDAILSTSPYYSKPSQEGIYRHYKTLAEHAPKPIILYNVPGRTGRNIEASTTLRLAGDCEMIGGIKEASGNMVQCMHILQHKPDDFLFVSGDDHIAMPLIACGSDGVISVIANAFPKEFSNLISLSLEYKFDEAQKLQNRFLDVIDLLFVENNPAGIKCFLSELGLIKNELRLPNAPLSDVYKQKVQAFLKGYK